ncbi:MAG: hypothetical protein IJS80_03010 [Lachnospiraceae bacterium]|nr:hypothetical protein [Lachnospiraceae bacterium]
MNNEFAEVFRQLGLSEKELPDNYDPDEFGRSLMRGFNKEGEISYAASPVYISGHSLETNYSIQLQ